MDGGSPGRPRSQPYSEIGLRVLRRVADRRRGAHGGRDNHFLDLRVLGPRRGRVHGRQAGPRLGALHGTMTAVFGLALGIVLAVALAIFGTTFDQGAAIPPVNISLAGGALFLFLANLLGAAWEASGASPATRSRRSPALGTGVEDAR